MGGAFSPDGSLVATERRRRGDAPVGCHERSPRGDPRGPRRQVVGPGLLRARRRPHPALHQPRRHDDDVGRQDRAASASRSRRERALTSGPYPSGTARTSRSVRTVACWRSTTSTARRSWTPPRTPSSERSRRPSRTVRSTRRGRRTAAGWRSPARERRSPSSTTRQPGSAWRRTAGPWPARLPNVRRSPKRSTPRIEPRLASGSTAREPSHSRRTRRRLSPGPTTARCGPGTRVPAPRWECRCGLRGPSSTWRSTRCRRRSPSATRTRALGALRCLPRARRHRDSR